MTIRLLSTYDGFAPQSIITLDSALETALIAGGNATANLTGGTVAYRERQPVMIQPAAQKRGAVNLIANRKAIVPLTEGSALMITPTAGTTGTYQRYDASGAAVGTLTAIGATALVVGPFEGDYTVEIKCTTGSLTVKAGDAVLMLDPLAIYGAIGNGVGDSTLAMQRFLSQGGGLILPAGRSYTVTDTLILAGGATNLDLNGSTITASFGTNYGKALFSNNKTTDASTQLTLRNGRLLGNCVVADTRFTADNPNAGLKVIASDIYFNTMDGNRREGTGFVVADQIDFSTFERLDIWNCDLPFMIGAAPPRRNCTQIKIDQIGIHQCNSVARLQGIDKLEGSQMDAARVGSGVEWAGNNNRHDLTEWHVEGIGYPGYAPSARVSAASAGRGYFFADSVQNTRIRLNKCSTIDLAQTGGTGVASAYIGRCDNVEIQSITFEDCTFTATSEGSAGFKALVNRGKFKWIGRFPYDGTQVDLSTTGLGFVDMEIQDVQGQPGTSPNLMFGNTVLSLINGIGTNPPTFAEVARDGSRINDSHTVTFGVGSYEMNKTVLLPLGWCTLDVTGFRTTGAPSLYVEQNGSPFTNIATLTWTMLNDKQRRTRLTFWNPTANQSYKIGYKASGGEVINVADNIAVYSGFAQDSPPRALVEVVSALPTASSRWLGRTAIVRVPGSADVLWRCLNNALNAPAWVTA